MVVFLARAEILVVGLLKVGKGLIFQLLAFLRVFIFAYSKMATFHLSPRTMAKRRPWLQALPLPPKGRGRPTATATPPAPTKLLPKMRTRMPLCPQGSWGVNSATFGTVPRSGTTHTGEMRKESPNLSRRGCWTRSLAASGLGPTSRWVWSGWSDLLFYSWPRVGGTLFGDKIKIWVLKRSLWFPVIRRMVMNNRI